LEIYIFGEGKGLDRKENWDTARINTSPLGLAASNVLLKAAGDNEFGWTEIKIPHI